MIGFGEDKFYVNLIQSEAKPRIIDLYTSYTSPYTCVLSYFRILPFPGFAIKTSGIITVTESVGVSHTQYCQLHIQLQHTGSW